MASTDLYRRKRMREEANARAVPRQSLDVLTKQIPDSTQTMPNALQAGVSNQATVKPITKQNATQAKVATDILKQGSTITPDTSTQDKATDVVTEKITDKVVDPVVSPLQGQELVEQQAVTPTITPVGFGQAQQDIDLATQFQKDVLQGQDFATQQLLNRQMEQSAATQAALRGAAAQRGQLSGLSGIQQEILAGIQDRQLASQEAEQLGAMAGVLGQRADTASGRLAQLGAQERAFEFDRGRQVVSDMIASSDLTDPQQLANVEAQYESIYGVKPSLDALIEQKWDNKSLKADAEWDSYVLNNEALFFDDAGNFKSDFAMSDPQALQIMSDKYEADTKGMFGEFNPSNPDHMKWAENQFKTATTTETELALQNSWDTIKNSNYFASLSGEEQAELSDDWDALSTMAVAGWRPTIVDGELALVDAGGSPVLSGGDFFKFGDTSIRIDRTDNTAVISGEEYEFEDGKWIDEDGVEVTSGNTLDALNSVSEQFVSPIEGVTGKLSEFTPSTAITSEIGAFIDSFDGSEAAVSSLTELISDRPEAITNSQWKKITENEEMLSVAVENIPSESIGSVFGNVGKDGTRPKQRAKFSDDVAEGAVFNVDGMLVRITSNPKSKDWKKGANHYGQTVTYEIISGPNKGKTATTSVGK